MTISGGYLYFTIMKKGHETDLLHNNALELIFQGEYEKALEILEDLEPTPEILNDRAVALHQLGRTVEALPLLKKAVKSDSPHAAAILNRMYMELAYKATPKPSEHRVVEDWGPPPGPAPTVSVVIPTYDRPDYIEEAVRSILNQTFKDIELIVVCDGGPPTAEGILRGMGSDRIRYIRIEHGGISTGLNAGITAARGRYVAYLDDDDIYYPDHIETLVKFFESNPEEKFAYTLSWECLQVMSDEGWKTIHRKLFYPKPFDRKTLLKGNCVLTTGSIMHHRDLVDEIGGFNEGIIGCQDWEFYLRVFDKYSLNFIDKVTLEHYVRKRKDAQLTSNRPVMRQNTVVVYYLNHQAIITSDVPGRDNYGRAMKSLGKLLFKMPDLSIDLIPDGRDLFSFGFMRAPNLIIDLLDLKELASLKPYAFFYRLGKDLAQLGDKRMARAAFFEGIKLAPWEFKLYTRFLFPHKSRDKELLLLDYPGAIKKQEWQEVLSDAVAKWRDGHTQTAIKILDDALDKNPKQPFYRLQKYYMEKALEYLKGAITIDMPPHNPGDPTVSVIMATYNRNTWIRESIDSLLAQTCTDWELIIVNDGGASEAEEIVSSYNDPRIKYVWAEHRGLSSALNVGLGHVRGKYIAFLDDDDVYYPEHLSNLVAALESHPDAPLAYTKHVLANQELVAGEYIVKNKEVGKIAGYDAAMLMKRNFLMVNTVLVRREGFIKHGGFNTAILHGMDWDMWIRLSYEGEFQLVPEATCEVRWREDGSSMTSSFAYRPNHFRNAIYTLHKEMMLDGELLLGWRDEKSVEALELMIDSDPKMIDSLGIHELLHIGNPLEFFELLAEEFAEQGNKEAEQAALKAALHLTPPEKKKSWFDKLMGD